MDITHLLDSFREDLARAAEVGGPDAKAAAERLLLALEPALRLTLMETLSQAASEVSAALPGVGVSVRLQGREPVFVVDGAAAAPQADAAFEDDDGESNARITLRIPEPLKARAETLAARRGQSLNTWLVAAVRAAASDIPPPPGGGHHGFTGKRMKGWMR